MGAKHGHSYNLRQSFFISHAGGEFYLTFGELVPPVTPNESADDLRKRVGDTLEIMPLVRLAITPEVMIKIAELSVPTLLPTLA